MFAFKQKYPRIEDSEKLNPDDHATVEDEPKAAQNSNVSADIIKINAKLDQFTEIRNVTNERLNRLNEQIGELRGMILDTNRSMQDMEVKTVKAVDLVEAVHPDKLMVEVRKQDAKIEALKANIESNDAIMKSLMEQLKELRHQMSSFRGLEQVVKLSDEVKTELMNIRKAQATVERHSDKIESIFVESQKRFQEFESLTDKLKEIQKQLSTVVQLADQNKVKLTTAAPKKDVEQLLGKVSQFEKHMGNIIDLLTKRANDLPKEIDDRFKKLEKNMNDAFDKRLRKMEAMDKLVEQIEKQAPKIAEELQITEKLKDVKVTKIDSEASEEVKESVEKTEKERGFFSKLFKKKEKKE